MLQNEGKYKHLTCVVCVWEYESLYVGDLWMYIQIVYTILLVGKQLYLFSWGEDLKLCMSRKCNIHRITVYM